MRIRIILLPSLIGYEKLMGLLFHVELCFECVEGLRSL